MITRTKQTRRPSALLAAAAAALVVAALPAGAHGDGWELQTSSKAVPGTRQIEAGNPEKAIRIAELYLPTFRPKSAALTNLCVGHLLLRDFDKAEQYCNEALARPGERAVAYNNRGVLRALQGDYAAALRDFSIAAGDKECDAPLHVPKDLRPVAQRNVERAEMRLLASTKPKDAGGVAVRADQ